MATDLLHLPPSCFLTRKLPKHSTPTALHRTALKFKIHCTVSTQNSQLTAEENRRSANYQPNMWNYDLLQSLTSDHQVKVYEDKASELEDRVRSMMNNEDAESLEILELIDDVQRLGLGYRFQGEIRRALDKIATLKDETNKSLHATALCFRLLRQHGYEVSQDRWTLIYETERAPQIMDYIPTSIKPSNRCKGIAKRNIEEIKK